MNNLTIRIEAFLGRSVDFTSEVQLQDDGAGAYISKWSCAEAEPTDPELLAQQSAVDSYLAGEPLRETQRLRSFEYLPMSEYMDAKAKQTSSDPVIVAEGVQQEADFHAGNLAVKAKYPKPV